MFLVIYLVRRIYKNLIEKIIYQEKFTNSILDFLVYEQTFLERIYNLLALQSNIIYIINALKKLD